ncbi:MAG: hypothetical protein ACHQVK_05335 [Candidatus Paceibacterales bacterium]
MKRISKKAAAGDVSLPKTRGGYGKKPMTKVKNEATNYWAGNLKNPARKSTKVKNMG